MEKNYFTNKEIIMGLRNDFLLRNLILLEIEKTLVPLKKDITIDATYDSIDKRVNLEANYNSSFKEMFKIFSRKYDFEASLKCDENGHFMLEEGDLSCKKIFPINFDIDIYIKLNKLYNRLIQNDYKIANDKTNIYELFNSLVIFERMTDLLSDMIEYNPRGDLLSIQFGNDGYKASHVEELLNVKHYKDELSDESINIIETNPNTYKPVRYLDSDFNDNNELNYGIRVGEKDILLVRKLIK